MAKALISDGLVAFVKRACPTCSMIEPQMREAAKARRDFQVVTQDDATFPSGVANLVDDRELDHSYVNNIEATPTLIRYTAGKEVERVMGWDRAAWQRLTGIPAIGAALPPLVPG
ncbi:MAG: thioredoxin family protein [Burkholderiales bacterium]